MYASFTFLNDTTKINNNNNNNEGVIIMYFKINPTWTEHVGMLTVFVVVVIWGRWTLNINQKSIWCKDAGGGAKYRG